MPQADPDYIVLGAGSAGCVVTHRLSEDPSLRVLLIEAGCSAEEDSAVSTPGQWASLLGSQYDWGYTTEPEPGLADRRLAFPRGKVLGGSSAINAMVHIRGDRWCFDGWRDSGNPGWGYDELLPFFKRSERNDAGPSPYRGGDGPLAVSRCSDPHEGHDAFLAAAVEQGFTADRHFDFNVPEPVRVAGFYQRNILHGLRHSAATAYLAPALARPNVDVRSAAQATRLIVEGSRVIGVEYVQRGQVMQSHATREVVLCAGAVASPRLLMLSGIGPADYLRAHGITVTRDLPGVGRNLQDHLKLSLRWKGRTTLPGSTVTAGLFTASEGRVLPDLQFYVGRGLDQTDEFVTITVSLVRPRSRGCISLRSANPFAPPMIQANYLEEPDDVAALARGARLARRIGGSRAFEPLRSVEIEPGPSVTSRTDVIEFIRRKADTIYHAAGTCRMGPASDPTAVVDSALAVHGLAGLRIADASIMPEIVAAPTHAACVAIGERAAALILGGASLKFKV